MSTHLLLVYYLWVAPHILQAALAVMIVRRRLVREFPAFFLYTVAEVLQFVALFVIDSSHHFTRQDYETAWVAGGVVSVILRFAVVHEVFTHVFSAYPALERLGTLLFRWATAVLMVVSVALVAYTTGNGLDRTSVAVGVIDRAVSIVQCGLLIFLLLLAKFLNFSWRTYAFGIALGLGFFASVQLMSTAIQSYLGVTTHLRFFDLVSMATYHCCVLFWIVALYLPERKIARVASVPSEGLEHWNEALEQLLQQ